LDVGGRVARSLGEVSSVFEVIVRDGGRNICCDVNYRFELVKLNVDDVVILRGETHFCNGFELVHSHVDEVAIVVGGAEVIGNDGFEGVKVDVVVDDRLKLVHVDIDEVAGVVSRPEIVSDDGFKRL